MKPQIKMLKTLHQAFSYFVEHCSLCSVMFCVYVYLLVYLSPGTSGAPVNVAMNKPITANITCGMFGRELYYPHTQIPWQASQRIDFECSNTSVHPPGAMVDGDSDTWWQSTSRFRMIQSGFGWQGNPEVVIELDLTQAFEVEHITLQMGDSKRPGRLELEKSLDGTSYRPWVYMVSEEGDCSNIYNTFLMNQPRSLMSVVCVAYQTSPLPKYENITFDFTAVPNFLAAWRNLQYLRIKFYGLDLTLGVLGDMFHHYTVQKLEVFAECMCNGHHTDCEHSNVTGQFECVCGENSEGRFCERCQPFYNQQPFRYQDPCEACECFGHSDTCYYNATIANFTMSLDASGKRSGGGVCIDCQDDTAGINCEKCKPYYYRPDGKTQRDKAVCSKCQCKGPGVTVNPETGLVGDCIMNNDRPLLPGQKPGDCFCKANVTGAQCDACKPGFFNLTMENPDGCQECACDTRGTVGASAKCTSDAAGMCTCKKFTRGRTCGDCTEGYYGMETSNPEGCKICVCNKGGAYNSICNQDTGQCPCRPYVGGLKCDGPVEGAYYPDLHHLSGEFEDLRTNIYQEIPGYLGLGYAKATESVPAEMFFSVDKYPALEGKYYLYVRYSNPQVTTALVRIYGDGFYENLAMVLRTCVNKWCYAQVGRRMTFDLTVSPVYQVTVRSTSPCYMDRIIALPVEFVSPTKFFGRNKARKFTKSCNVIMNDMKEGKPKEDYCLTSVFELTAFYFNGSLPCNCNMYGSVNATSQCEKYKGQCLCREGVGGRACDQCNAGYFNLTLDGCTKCDCAGEHKVCNRTTGQCECPPFTTGRRCDVCEPEYWKWSSTDGCQACNCSDIGSVSLNCNQTTGVCDCKPGVGGDKCDQCKEGFRQFSDSGCLPCNCDPDGSLSPVCDQTTAQCPCKTHTTGQLCDQCKAGSFYMSESHSSGCLECICMGITDRCGSTGLREQTMDVVLINSTTNATAFFLTSSTLGGNIPVTLTSVEGSDMVQGQMTGAADFYFTAFQGLVGNLVGLYKNVISFDVFWLEGQPLGTQQDACLWIYGRKDTKFSFSVPSVPSNQTTRVNVTITEDNAVKTSGNVTRGELLLALTDVQQVLYPAVWYSLPHTSSIGNIRYEYPSATGTGEQALSVEQCQCGPGYEGLSCEKCAFGYHRENKTTHDYLGTCKKCECYGHADLCDPETGKCINCQHNTKGKNCEICADGYYGDPTQGTPSDCQLCPCYTPRVTNSSCKLRNGSIQCQYCNPGYTGNLCDRCESDYFGNPEVLFVGRCEKCDCKGNTDRCNVTNGKCLDCQNNSTGDNCERCIEGYFGNSTAQNCQPCACNMTGANSTICDHQSGQCSCFPGVGSRDCGRCKDNYYGYSNSSIYGCVPCSCNPSGSGSLQCDEDGICTCKKNTGGDKCDFCGDFLFGLPYNPCAPCDCNATGTVDPSKPCERIHGQCECKPGVRGRQCDQCDRLHINFGPNGCQQCGPCQDSLGNDTLVLQEEWQTCWNVSQVVGAIQEQDTVLQRLSQELNQTSSSLGMSEDRLSVLRDTMLNLTQSEAAINVSVSTVMNKVINTESSSRKLETDSGAELARLQGMLDVATKSKQLGMDTYSRIREDIKKLAVYNQTAYALMEEGASVYAGMNKSFDQELANISRELGAVQLTSGRSDKRLNRALLQYNQTVNLEDSSQAQKQQFENQTAVIRDMDATIIAVQAEVDDVLDTLNLTLHYRASADALYKEAQESLLYSEAVLTTSTNNYNDAHQLIQDTHDIYNSQAGSLPPLNSSVNTRRLSSWTSGADQLEVAINTTRDSLDSCLVQVVMAENKAQELTDLAQSIKDEFEKSASKGQAAVDAIQRDEDVVSLLNSSLTTAKRANETISEALEELRSVTVADLQQQVAQAESRSNSLTAEITSRNNLSYVMDQRLDAVNASLYSAAKNWSDLNPSLKKLYGRVASLQALAKDPGVMPIYTEGVTAADDAVVKATTVTKGDADLQPLLQKTKTTVETIKTNVLNSTKLYSKVQEKYNAFNDKLENSIQARINQTMDIYIDTNKTRDSIDSRLASIEAKLARMQTLVSKLDQPVAISASAYISHGPGTFAAQLQHNEVSLQFRYSKQPQGVLFYVENNLNSAKMLLHLHKGKVVFEYDNGGQTVTLTSRAELCPACWFTVLATRYQNEGRLTVTKTNTGGSTTAYNRGHMAQVAVSFNSPLYIGGVPSALSKVKLPNITQFEGCIHKLTYDGRPVPLWENQINAGGDIKCCQSAAAPPGRPVIDGASFDGFGYISLNPASFSVVGQSHVSIQFRTFSPSGVVLLVDKTGVNEYYGMFLNRGRVVFEYGNSVVKVSLSSSRTYNNGNWYRVTAMHNSSYAVMYVRDVNETQAADVVSMAAPTINLATLRDASLTIGGQNPNTVISLGSVSQSFAGCMRDFEHNVDPSLTLFSRSLNETVISSSGVVMNQCLEQVISGIGFKKSDSYARLGGVPSLMVNLQSTRFLDFEFYSYNPHGILLYAQSSSNSNIQFYITLYHGDVFLQFNQGTGFQQALRTTGLYLSDGLRHHVFVDLSITNSPRLYVDGSAIYGSATMMAGFTIAGGVLHVGGITPSVTLPSVYPISSSLVGGIRNLKVNNIPFSFYQTQLLTSSQFSGVYLSGLSAPPTTAPEPPFTTTPAPPTLTPPTCANPDSFAVSAVGLRFGDAAESYAAFDLPDGLDVQIRNSFAITLEFRALQPSGILYYAASKSGPNPLYYFCLFLSDGHLVFSMDTNSLISNSDPKNTKKIKSIYKYNDGNWWEVTVLRINDFVALVVTSNRDYKNNQVSSSSASQMIITTPVYLGGVPQTFLGLPFSGANDIPIGNIPFHGCVRKFSIAIHKPDPFRFDISNPASKAGTTFCYENVLPGVYMNGSSAYIMVSDPTTSNFDIAPGFSLNITFRTTTRNGTLMSVYFSMNQFIHLDIFNGEVRLIIGNPLYEYVPFEAGESVGGSYSLCDYQSHTVSFKLHLTGATLTIDNYPAKRTLYPVTGYSLPSFADVPIYIGGMRDNSVPLPVDASKHALHGCIKSVYINNKSYMLTQMTQKRGATIGCPAA